MNIIQVDPNVIYRVSKNDELSNITSLMYLVLNTREHPEYLEQIKYILDNNIQELRITKHGWNALNIAVSNSNTSSTIDTVKLLLDYHDKISTSPTYIYLAHHQFYERDYYYYRTALYTAIQDSCLETVKLLLDHDNFVNKLDKNNRNILFDLIICEYNKPDYYLDMIRYILYNTKIDIYHEDNKNMLVYDYCIAYQRYDVKDLLDEYLDDSLDIKNALDI